MIKDKDSLALCLDNIKKVWKELDYISDPAIEDFWVCVSECCSNIDMEVFDIFKNPSQELQHLLGVEGLQLTYQLDKIIEEAVKKIDYVYEKGFSKTQEWLDFVSHINKINFFLKDVVRKYDINKIFRQWCKVANVEQVKILLQYPYGVNVNSVNKYGNTALITACFNGKLELAQLLLEYGADPNIVNVEGNTGLMLACDDGHVEIVNLLLQHKADVNIRDKVNSTALFDACANGSIEIVKLLLEHNADPNIVDDDGDMALTFTVDRDSTEMAELLLRYGAHPTVLVDAARRGAFELATLLLQQPTIDINAIGKDGETALIEASFYGYPEIVKLLLQHNADVNITDKNGRTALILACYENYGEIIRLLLESGINVDAVCNDGYTALVSACDKGYKESTNLLLRYGSNVNFIDSDGDTPLIIASARNHIEIVELLLEYGADPKIVSSYGDTAFTIACRKDFTEIIEILRDNGGACKCCDFALKKKKFMEKYYFVFLWALGFSAFATGLFLQRGIAFELLIFSYIISAVVLGVVLIRYIKQE